MDCLLHCQVLQLNLPVFHGKLVVWKGQKRGSKEWRDEEETAIEQEQLAAHVQWVCLKIIINNFDCNLRKECRNNKILAKTTKIAKMTIDY